MKRRSGLTLLELTVAVVIVGVAASVAVPAAMSRRILANEASAMAALRDVAAAQTEFQAAAYVDVNENGIGEFGMFRELTGAVGARLSPTAESIGLVLDPPLLSREMRRFDRHGEVRRAGFVFRIFLPTAEGVGVGEVSKGRLPVALDSALCEANWCCYAWPATYGLTGTRTFFINQTGDITVSDARHSGSDAFLGYRPSWGPANVGAVFAGSDPTDYLNLRTITGTVAVGTVGRDGNLWQLASPHADARDLVARGRLSGGNGYAVVDRGSFEIVSHQEPAGTRETIVVRATHLRPGRRYGVTINGVATSSPGVAIRARADAHGVAVFRFDSRDHRYPAGISSLTDLVGGWIGIGYGVGARVPDFKPAGDTTPVAETIADDEASAIASLREIAAAQTKFKEMDATQFDGSGVAEYGLLRELTGLIGVRTNSNAATIGAWLDPPLLPPDFAAYAGYTEVARSGYLFHLFLPGDSGIGVSDISSGAVNGSIDSNLAATTWCCYASPQRFGVTGARTFFIGQDARVVATDAKYSGTGAFGAPSTQQPRQWNAGAALASGGPLQNITGNVAVGTVGRDGNLWRTVPSRPDEHDFVVRGAMTPPTSGAATGAFIVESNQLTNATDDAIDVRATQIDASTEYRVVLTDATGATSALFGTTTSDARGRVAFHFDGRFHSPPDGVASVTAFSGGTIELRDGDTPVLRGAIPVFATIGGPTVAGSSVVFHVKKPLDALPNSLPRCGSLDVRVTNAPDGRREQLTVAITTYDPGAAFNVVAIDGHGVATPLGAIRVAGRNGTGSLLVDTQRGDVVLGAIVALSGETIEVRATTGAAVLAGTMPVVQ